MLLGSKKDLQQDMDVMVLFAVGWGAPSGSAKACSRLGTWTETLANVPKKYATHRCAYDGRWKRSKN